MSVKVMGMVWDADLPANEKLILLAYADHADHHGKSIYPAIKTVARKTGYKPRNVQYITRKLEERGLLVPDGVSKNGTNKWMIPLQELQGVQSLQGCKIQHKGVQPSAPEPSFNHQFNNIYKLYKNHIAPTMSQILAEELAEYEDQHEYQHLEKAFKIGEDNNVRTWNYVRTILDNWKIHGYDWTPTKFKKGKQNGSAKKPVEYSEADRQLAAKLVAANK